MVTAEIITIGDEILIGQIVDTNSAWLGSHLSAMGVSLSCITSIGDDAALISSTLGRALKENDITLVTGGLGPTKDDITKKTLASLFSCELVKHEPSYEHVRSMLSKKGIPFTELNQQQAYVPSCAEIIVNEWGTAPALLFRDGAHILICMPGVPFEMKSLCTNKIFPLILSTYTLKGYVHVTKIVYNFPESLLSEHIEEWEDNLPEGVHLAYLPSPGRVRLRLSSYGAVDSSELEALFATLRTNYLSSHPFSNEGEPLEAIIACELVARGETLSVAESCTGGALAARFTSLSGASAYFRGGVVAYDNDVKHRVLGVSTDILEGYGAVSEPVVCAMAEGARKLLGTDYAIATSGVAGPTGGTLTKPVGMVCIAVSSVKGTVAVTKMFTSLREQNIEYACSHGVSMLNDIIFNK